MPPATPPDSLLKDRILRVFKFTADFLRRHHLRYVACGGTVLGAVRHQGFIPWDDDIDIYLPRKDYERLLDLKQEARREGFDVLSLRDEGYYLPFAKVADMSTTLWEEEQFPFLMGVFVDLFALDCFDCSDARLTAIQRRSQKKFYHYLKSVSNMPTRGLLTDILHADTHRAQYKLEVLLSRPLRRWLLRQFMDYQRWYSSFDGDKAVCVTQWPGRIFRREWFDDTIDVPFADTTVVIPRDYDAYLTCLYGDYMTLPPVEKRVSDHKHHYLNLDGRVTPPGFPERLPWQ